MISKNHSLLLSFEIEETVSSGKIVPSTSNYVNFLFFLAERYFDEKKDCDRKYVTIPYSK